MECTENVAEWTADVYRPIIDEEASDFNYYRGNMPQQTVKMLMELIKSRS